MQTKPVQITQTDAVRVVGRGGAVRVRHILNYLNKSICSFKGLS